MWFDMRTRDRLRDFLNGKWDQMDEGSRMGFTVICDEIDGLHDQLRRINQRMTFFGTTLVVSMVGLIATLLAQ